MTTHSLQFSEPAFQEALEKAAKNSIAPELRFLSSRIWSGNQNQSIPGYLKRKREKNVTYQVGSQASSVTSLDRMKAEMFAFLCEVEDPAIRKTLKEQSSKAFDRIQRLEECLLEMGTAASTVESEYFRCVESYLSDHPKPKETEESDA